MTSLRRRALAGALVWTAAVFVIGLTGLVALFDRIATTRFNETLEERLVQVSVALSYGPASEEALSRSLIDPAYIRPYSGRYWQVKNLTSEATFVSPSLFDTVLDPPQPEGQRPVSWQGAGPGGTVRGLAQNVILEDGSAWTLAVAESLDALIEERRLVMNGAAVVFLFLGLLSVAGAAALIAAVLRPIEKLATDVENRWSAGIMLDPDAYPREIVPLVNDVNTLAERNRDIVARARRRAADLAHALKTPASALRNELETLGDRGGDVSVARETLDRIDAQIKRTLIRMRAEYAAADVQAATSVPESFRRLERLFRSSAGTCRVRLSMMAEDALALPVNPQDFEEALGNITDNALKWAASQVSVTARGDAEGVVVDVEDDGPGVAENQLAAILEPAYRIDTSVSGSGLGLAITTDLVQAYGGEIHIGRSEVLGGLRVRLRFPRRAPGLDRRDGLGA
jgi:signal transduction histidine kinase